MVAYRAPDLSAMTMFSPGELMIPVAAGPIRGPRHERLLGRPERQLATRAVIAAAHNRLDGRATATNNGDAEACSVVVTIYARTRLRVELVPQRELVEAGSGFEVTIEAETLAGAVVSARGFGRLIGPVADLAEAVARVDPGSMPRRARRRLGGKGAGIEGTRFDAGVLLGLLERERPELADIVDEEVAVVTRSGHLQLHVEKTAAPGGQHLGVYVEGVYCPEHDVVTAGSHDHGNGHDHAEAHDDHSNDHADADGHEHGPDCRYEQFTRFLNASVATVGARSQR